jgi:hypothetical protein
MGSVHRCLEMVGGAHPTTVPDWNVVQGFSPAFCSPEGLDYIRSIVCIVANLPLNFLNSFPDQIPSLTRFGGEENRVRGLHAEKAADFALSDIGLPS